jgi:hypothetical protein
MANDENPYTKRLPYIRTGDGTSQILYDPNRSHQAEWDSIVALEKEVLRLKRACDQSVLSGTNNESIQAQYEAAQAELDVRKAAFGMDGV